MHNIDFFNQCDKLVELLRSHYGNCEIEYYSSSVKFIIEIPINIMSNKRFIEIKYLYNKFEADSIRNDFENIIYLVNNEIVGAVDKILKTL